MDPWLLYFSSILLTDDHGNSSQLLLHFENFAADKEDIEFQLRGIDSTSPSWLGHHSAVSGKKFDFSYGYAQMQSPTGFFVYLNTRNDFELLVQIVHSSLEKKKMRALNKKVKMLKVIDIQFVADSRGCVYTLENVSDGGVVTYPSITFTSRSTILPLFWKRNMGWAKTCEFAFAMSTGRSWRKKRGNFFGVTVLSQVIIELTEHALIRNWTDVLNVSQLIKLLLNLKPSEQMNQHSLILSTYRQ